MKAREREIDRMKKDSFRYVSTHLGANWIISSAIAPMQSRGKKIRTKSTPRDSLKRQSPSSNGRSRRNSNAS
jgi:hypothetical protein